jgi:hypothetical protein
LKTPSLTWHILFLRACCNIFWDRVFEREQGRA